MSTAVMEQPPTVETFICPGHGNVTLRRTPEQRYCGTECSNIIKYGMQKRPCATCGEIFETADPEALCSKTCTKANRAVRKTAKARRRRQRGLSFTPEQRDAVRAKRAGQPCWLCGLGFIEAEACEVMKDDRGAQFHLAKTIDHILHAFSDATVEERQSIDNLEVAHFSCNTRRDTVESNGGGQAEYRAKIQEKVAPASYEYLIAQEAA